MSIHNNHYNTIIIGGGASGMMAAVFAASGASSHEENGVDITENNINQNKILIIEKNSELGKKLKITGGGRCNILNAEYDTEKLLSNYVGAKKYLHTPFSKFGVSETVEFFKNIGIEIKIEDRKRAFPKSEKAMDVFNALYKKIESFKDKDGNNTVEIKLNTRIQKFSLSKNKVEYIEIVSNVDGKEVEEKIYGDKFILATGGMSHKETGSDGFGFSLLEKIGIQIDPFNPSLVPISVSNNWVKNLSGKSIENIKLTFSVDGIKKKVLKLSKTPPQPLPKGGALNAEGINRILFTHFGLSGPTILNTSKQINEWLQEGEVNMSIDLFPESDEKVMDIFLLNIFDNNKNKLFKNVLNNIYGGNVLETIFRDKNFCLENNFDMNENGFLEKPVHSISKVERRKLVNVLKSIKINITGLMSYEKAIIADGGVNLGEINFENMSLKKVSNLHVTGDLLNITRPSGGYSLQLCWTTGHIAGKA